jgi:hypothetical protein
VPKKVSPQGLQTSRNPILSDVSPIAQGFQDWYARQAGEPTRLDVWVAAIRWYQAQLIEAPHQDPETTEPTVPTPVRVIQQIIETLEQTTDLPDAQQSPALLALISELKELIL